MLDFQILFFNIFIQDRTKPSRRRTSQPRWTNASTTSTCPSATWTVELEEEEGTCRILDFYQFVWRPKVEASSRITVSARTRTSNISASKETSSAKSKSVNTSFPGVTPGIPRYTVRSIIWSIGPKNRSGANLQPRRTPLPTATSRTSHHQRRHSYMCPCAGLPWDPQLSYASWR